MTIPFLPHATIVDLSHWNPETRTGFAEAIDAGLVGAVVKVSQGASGRDPLAASTLPIIRDANLLLGTYHFGDASDPRAQAISYIKNLVSLGITNNDELMLDWEQYNDNTMSSAQAEVFIQTVFSIVGRYPLLYTGKFGASGAGDGLPSTILSRCDLVLAKYGDMDDLASHLPAGFKPPEDDTSRGGVCRFWQYTNGAINGAPFPGLGAVDQWRALGFSSIDALRARWGH